MALVIQKDSKSGMVYWDGQSWTSDKSKAKSYKDRDDIMEQEKAKLKEIDYGWRFFLFEEFAPDYNNGLACAIARDQTEAKELIQAEYNKVRNGEPEWGKISEWPLDKSMAAFVLGGG